MYNLLALRHSSAFRRAEHNEILTKPEDVIDNFRVQPSPLLGHSECLFWKCLMKEYCFTSSHNHIFQEINKAIPWP